MRTLVTGHRGFIGSHLMQHGMVGFDIKDDIEYDITNSDAVENCWEENKPDIVVHLAANPRTDLAQKHPCWDAKVNVGGTLNVLQASLKNDVKLLVFASTCLVYDESAVKPISESASCNPRNPYAISKYAGELYCKNFQERGLNICILRFFNVYGPRQLSGYVIPDLIKKISTSEGEINVSGPQNDSRDFVYVNDVVDAIKSAIGNRDKVSGEIINIGNGREVYIEYLCHLIARTLNKGIKFNYKERPLGRSPGTYRADISKATELLNWTPKINIEEGVRNIVESFTHRWDASF